MIYREIGGYLSLESFSGEPYHRDALALNCGRACLDYLLELRGIESIWLPDFLCDSVVGLCLKRGVSVKTYTVGADFLPVYDFAFRRGDYLYLVDYYGQLSQGAVDEASLFSSGRLIVDEVQNFYQNPWGGVDVLYSCRKFFGVADGAYLYLKDGQRLGRHLPVDESCEKMEHLLGRYERSASEFFGKAQINNDRFAEEPVKIMSPITSNIMRAVDYDRVRLIRNANYEYVADRLASRNVLETEFTEAPFAYPLLLRGASSDIRSALADRKIFVPTLWPNVVASGDDRSVACYYAKNILPLPVDQRYDISDMERLVGCIDEALCS